MGVAAAGVAAAAIAAGGTAYAASQQKKAARSGQRAAGRISEAELLQRNVISEKVGAEAQFAREQLRSSETARGLVMGQLGAPGTYGGQSAGQGQFGLNLAQPSGLAGMAASAPQGIYGERTIEGVAEGGKYNKKTGKFSGEYAVTGTVDDPFQTASNITNQAQFSAVSALVGEAIQLGNREGQMWDDLNNSAIGSVMQGAARQQRQAMEMIARGMSRGGSARRSGMAMAQKMAAQESINRNLTDGLWQARVSLEATRSQIMQSNISFAMNWVDNQAGIRDSYTNTLASLRTFWSGIAPALLSANTNAAGAAHQSNAMATDSLMSAQATQGQAIAGAAQSLGGVLMKQVGGIMDSNDVDAGVSGTNQSTNGALYGPNPTSADY